MTEKPKRGLQELTALFATLGASNPGQWARSQIEEGIPQLERFLFLKQAWSQVVPEDDPSWIGNSIAAAAKDPNGPFSGIGLALKSLMAKGATEDELTALARGMQAALLFGFCFILEGPHGDDGVEGVGWGLFSTNAEGSPAQRLIGLHESLLETDPTGREMRPRT
ncbi:MAG TPA: hypothetical protein VFV47_08580 [Hyphomicrobiaceae bacterium]|nr:hypothetical protein [Hyphomicrobiaceae bacterium]